MSEIYHHNVILLRTAAITLIIGLILAWCLVFTIPMKIPYFLDIFKDTDALLSAHLDFLMMTMLLLGFYASKIPLAGYVVWPMALGSIGNPTLFLFGAIEYSFPLMPIIVFSSIVLTTMGYGLASIKILRYSFRAKS